MAFKQAEAEALLVDAGRMCAICFRLHGVQLHHIVSRGEGGTDEIDNAIPLCPNCHDEVHGSGAVGRVTRAYSVNELKGHRARVIDLAARQTSYSPGSADREADEALLLFFAQVLDRPAFRTPFHLELSYEDFDRALEDSVLALNTGYLRTRDGTAVQHAHGRIALVNPEWREKLDAIAASVEAARRALRSALGLDHDIYQLDRLRWREFDDIHRGNRALADDIDGHRQRAIDTMNELLHEIGRPGLKGVRGW
jgi:hypothetical protein